MAKISKFHWLACPYCNTGEIFTPEHRKRCKSWHPGPPESEAKRLKRMETDRGGKPSCPQCGGDYSRVVESRPSAEHAGSFRRRRRCLSCQWVFTTLEVSASELANIERLRRVRARWRVREAVSRGLLTRQPCESCGEAKVHAHHEDYAQPLLVRWLCGRCHREVHQKSN